MLTYVYEPNQERIEQRKQMQLFGKTAQSLANTKVSNVFPAPTFYTSQTVQPEASIYKYTPTYRSKTEYKAYDNISFTIRVYNIPRNLSRDDFMELVSKKVQDPVFHCNYVQDKIKNVFLGVAYLRFRNEKSGRQAMNALDGTEIGDLIIGADIARNQC